MDILRDVRAVLETTPLRWHELMQRFPEALLRRQPLAGEWSALECLQHLIDLDQAVFARRVRAILAGERFPAYDPEAEGTRVTEASSPAAMATQFAALRAESLALLETLTPDDLARQGVHGQLGTVTLSELLHEWGGHDLMHLVQAEQALMQPFIAGCGPWQVYFQAHVARESAE